MSSADQEFERALLASARADEPPADRRAEITDQAWARFSARAVALGDVLRGQSPRSESGRGAGHGHVARTRTVSGAHWRWLLAGALGGSAVTAGLFALRPPVQVGALAVGGAEASPPPARPAPTVAVPVPAPARIEQRPAIRRERRRNQQTGRASVDPSALAAPPSNLAAEVAALDAARAAATSGQLDQALALISRYHYDFPAGELAADAEVIAIEALDAKNDRAEMTRRASRFVEQHPDDPHAGRIKRLLRDGRSLQ
ncbi:MAG: hypothetical protein ACJ8F1_13035 [Polyangia bacterium]